MKREIKFRSAFFNIKTDKFSHFHYWGFLNHKNEYDENCFKAPAQNSHAYRKTDDQFTGLKDKQGKEIYEGDILDNHFKVEWNQLHNGFALFNKKGYCHQLMADEYNLTGESLPPWQINAEVIGNIYENLELLNT